MLTAGPRFHHVKRGPDKLCETGPRLSRTQANLVETGPRNGIQAQDTGFVIQISPRAAVDAGQKLTVKRDLVKQQEVEMQQ